MIVGGVFAASSLLAGNHGGAGRSPSGGGSSAPPAVEAGQLPWSLPNPISRVALLASPTPDRLTLLGGLDAGGSSARGVYTLDTTNGHLARLGSLTGRLHDASGVLLQGHDLLFGGGNRLGSAATVQSLLGAASTPPRGAIGTLAAKVIGRLPEVRSGSSAVTIGDTAYIVGGYNGTTDERSVVATTTGRSFRVVGSLPIGVRYPAVAVLSGRILVFGGEVVDRSGAARPSTVIQQVDPTSGKGTVIARLPVPLYGAAAATLGGVVYVAGGMTSSPVSGSNPLATVWAYDPETRQMLQAGRLRVPVAHAGAAVVGSRMWIVGGTTTGGAPVTAVQVVEANRTFGTAGVPGAGSPFFGDKLLVADEGNDRLLLLSDTGSIVWRFPSATAPGPPGGFSADDAFFARHGTVIVTNEETKNVLAEVAYPSGKILWTYGHFARSGPAPGYLNTPDDAYLLPDGNVITADIANCRVIVIDPKTSKIVTQMGTTGRCVHDMAPPLALGSPNGDTPLPNGNILISEINGSYVDELTPQGKPLWWVHLPISYPSDPQQIGPDRYLIADYTQPGSILEFNRQGQVLFRYEPTSGPGMLDHPSLVEMLPNGILMLNDDYNDRMIAIDPATGALVWQYGIDHTPGSRPGMLSEPDGFDILAAKGRTPTHTGTA